MRRVVFIMSLFAVTAMANHGGDFKNGGGHHGAEWGGEAPSFLGLANGHFVPKEGPCADVKLDKDQKTQIKDIYFKYDENKIDLDAQQKKALLEYSRVLNDSKSDFKAAQAAAALYIDSNTKLLAAREELKNQVTFNILRTDQRQTAFDCSRYLEHPPRPEMPRGHEKERE